MKHAPRHPLISKTEIDAMIGAISVWLDWMASALLRLQPPRKTRRLEIWLLRRLERWTECALFFRAVHLMNWRPCATSRIGLRPGFRITIANARLLVKSARVRLRDASPLQRALRLVDALARPERYLNRFMRSLARIFCVARLIAAQPPARMLFGCIAAPMPALADSS